MRAYAVVAAVAAGTYLFRVSMLVVGARRELPRFLGRAVRYAVPSAFAALAAGSVRSQAVATGSLAPAVAVVAGAVVVRRTGSAPAALVAGLPVFWLLAAATG